jgi:hypothetical protein
MRLVADSARIEVLEHEQENGGRDTVQPNVGRLALFHAVLRGNWGDDKK